MLRIKFLLLHRNIYSHLFLQNRQIVALKIPQSSSFVHPHYVKKIVNSVINEKCIPSGNDAERMLAFTGYLCPGLSESERNSLSQKLWTYFLENGVCHDNPELFDTLLNTCYENNVEIDLQSLLNSMKAHNAPISNSSYRSVLRYFSLRGDINSLTKVLPIFKLTDGSLPQDVYFDVAICYIKSGQAAEADAIFNKLKNNGYVLSATQIDNLSLAHAEMANIDQVFSTYLKHTDRTYSPHFGLRIYESLLQSVGIEQANKFLDIVPSHKLTSIHTLSFLKRLLILPDATAFHRVCMKCTHFTLPTTFFKELLIHKMSASDIIIVASRYKWNIHDMIGSLAWCTDDLLAALITYADKTQQMIDLFDVSHIFKLSNGNRLSFSASIDLFKAACKHEAPNFDFLYNVLLPHYLHACNRQIEDVLVNLEGIVDENLLKSAYLLYLLKHRKLYKINRFLHEQHQKDSSLFLNDLKNDKTLIGRSLWLPQDSHECSSSAEMIARLSYLNRGFAISLLQMSPNVCEPALLDEFVKAVKEHKTPKFKWFDASKFNLKRFFDNDTSLPQKSQTDEKQSTSLPSANKLTRILCKMDSADAVRKYLASELSHLWSLNNLVLQCISNACSLGFTQQALNISEAFISLFSIHSSLSAGSDGEPRLVGFNNLLSACVALMRCDKRDAAFNLLEAGAFCLQKEWDSTKYSAPRESLLTNLLNDFSKPKNSTQQFSEVKRLAKVVEKIASKRNGGMPATWLKSITEMYLAEGNDKLAYQWFQQHRARNSSIDSSSGIVHLVQNFVDKGEFETAQKVAIDYVTKNVSGTDLQVDPVRQMCTVRVSTILVSALMRSNQMERVKHIVDSLPKRLVSDLVLLLYGNNDKVHLTKLEELIHAIFENGDPIERESCLKRIFNGAIGMHYASLAGATLKILSSTSQTSSSWKSAHGNVIFTANIAKSVIPQTVVCDALQFFLEVDQNPSAQRLVDELRDSHLTKDGVVALSQLPSEVLCNELALSAFHRSIAGAGNLANYRLLVNQLCEVAATANTDDDSRKKIGALLLSLVRSCPRYARCRLLLALLEVMPEQRLAAWPDLEHTVLHFGRLCLLDLALQRPWQEVAKLSQICALPQVGAAAEAAYWARNDAMPEMIKALTGHADADSPVDLDNLKHTLHILGILIGQEKNQEKAVLISKVMLEVRQRFPQLASALANSVALHLRSNVVESCLRASELSPTVRLFHGIEHCASESEELPFEVMENLDNASNLDSKILAVWLVKKCAAHPSTEDEQREMVLYNVIKHLLLNTHRDEKLSNLAKCFIAHGAAGVLPLRHLRDLMITDHSRFDTSAQFNSSMLAAQDQLTPLQILDVMSDKSLGILAECRPARLHELQMAAEAADLREHPVARLLAQDCLSAVNKLGSRDFGFMLMNCTNLTSQRVLNDCFVLLKKSQLQPDSINARRLVRRVLFLDRLLSCKDTKFSELQSLRKATAEFAQSMPVAGHVRRTIKETLTPTEK